MLKGCCYKFVFISFNSIYYLYTYFIIIKLSIIIDVSDCVEWNGSLHVPTQFIYTHYITAFLHPLFYYAVGFPLNYV